MTRCTVCGTNAFAYSCNHCGGKFCSDHRLPENHNCSGLRSSKPASTISTTSSGGPASDQDLKWYWTVIGLFFLPLLALWKIVVLAINNPGKAAAAGLLVSVALVHLGYVSAPAIGDVELADGPAALATDSVTPTADEAAGPAATETAATDPTTDAFRRTVERAIHEEVNEFRVEHGASRLSYDSQLAGIALGHSARMAEVGQIYHSGPDGSMEDRYRRAGYECRVPISGNRYATGAENVAQTWYRTAVTTTEGVVTYDSVAELAAGVVEQWAGSPGHRENMLRPYWRREGIGVAVAVVDGDYAVYVTQNFC